MRSYVGESHAFVIIGSKTRPLGNASLGPVMNALVMHEWANGYDGWFASAIGSMIAGSACEGRMTRYQRRRDERRSREAAR